ncbi:reverse transcriptase domain-containing protein [Tanacetum coccineum]
MTGVPRSIAKHRLNIREGYSPVRQKKRGQALERAKAIQAEVHKLVEAGIMREVYYHEWLSNPVMVKKHDSSWRMCVDFTDLNKVYPLSPDTDGRVRRRENGFPHQLRGILLYQNAFRPQNVGATYQQLVYKAFDSQFGRNIEVYVHDLVIKSHTEAEMLRYIDETFRTLRKINMKLNPKKCTFGAVEGMFLGFLSKPAERSLPLFKTLKKCIKKSYFHWTPEAEQAFKQLKQHLSELPLLVAPKPKKELIVYLSAAYGAISVILMTERGTVQMLVYFVSRTLQGPELNYTPMEKLVLSLVFVAKRLRRTIKKIKHHAGRTQYHLPAKDEPWTLFTEGSSCIDGSGVGLILTILKGTEFTYALRFQFTASNNEAEYEALIAGLWIAAQMGVRNVHVSVDSKLVANQVLGTYIAKEENMIKYLEKVKILVSGFANFSISQVPRSKNKKATSFAHSSKQVLVKILKEKSIQEKEVTIVVEEDGPTWMTPIIEYLKERTLPDDRKEASKLRIKARQYELLEEILYRRSFLKLWLRCVRPLQADYVV